MTASPSPSSRKALLTLLVLPLLLLCLSLWQMGRVGGTDANAQELVELDAQLAELREMAAGPRAWSQTVEFSDGKRYGLRYAIQILEAERADLLSGGRFDGLAGILATVGAVASAGVLLVNLAGLWFIWRMGRQAMASRGALLRAFDSGQRLLPWLLLVSIAGMACAVLCAGVFEMLETVWEMTQTRGGVKLFGFGAIALALMAYAAFRLVLRMIQAMREAFSPQPLHLMGRLTTPEEAPGLWQLVQDVARRVGAAVPDHIVVGLNEGFFVTEHPVRLSSGKEVPPGRLLYLPLPYMAFLGKDEVSAIIGHELGHFMGEDTEYSLRFSPIYASATRHLYTIDEARSDDTGAWAWFSKPAFHLGEFFLQSFHESVQHWSRQRELAADQVGAACSSREASALALLRSSVLAPRIDQALQECWDRGDKAGGGVLERTRELVKSQGLDDASAYLDECQSHPTDSHPTTRQRVDALGVTVGPQMLARARDAAESGLLQQLGMEAPSATDGQAVGAASEAGLAQVLEAEFRSNADAQRRERIEFLTGLARQGQDTLVVHEGGLIGMVVASLFAVGAVAVAVWGKNLSAEWRTGLVLAAFFLIALVVRKLRQRRTPLMTLGQQGMQFANLDRPLPWSAIEDLQAQAYTYSGVTVTTLTMALDAERQKLAFEGDRRFKLKKGKLIVSVQGVRKMSNDAFLETLHSYWQGGLARAELERLGA